MKLNIEELALAANAAAMEAVKTPDALHEGFDRERMKAFARLIVERCAEVADDADCRFDGHAIATEIRDMLED